MIIQQGMNIKIRTREELEIFVEIANKEEHRLRDGSKMTRDNVHYPAAISVGYRSSDKYPNDISRDSIGFCGGLATNVVEASQLFRNQLISKRLK